MSSQFWGNDPCALFTDLSLIPSVDMSINEKLNALTRLALLISLVLYLMDYEQWSTFLLVALSLIVLFHVSYSNKKEGFTLTPTYKDTDFTQTVVAPVYDNNDSLVQTGDNSNMTLLGEEYSIGANDYVGEEMRPSNYPYGQVLTKTNLLPSDEYLTHMGSGSVIDAKNYANSAFLRHRLANQENMMRIYKKKLARRFKHSATTMYDTVSAFSSY